MRNLSLIKDSVMLLDKIEYKRQMKYFLRQFSKLINLNAVQIEAFTKISLIVLQLALIESETVSKGFLVNEKPLCSSINFFETYAKPT